MHGWRKLTSLAPNILHFSSCHIRDKMNKSLCLTYCRSMLASWSESEKSTYQRKKSWKGWYLEEKDIKLSPTSDGFKKELGFRLGFWCWKLWACMPKSCSAAMRMFPSQCYTNHSQGVLNDSHLLEGSWRAESVQWASWPNGTSYSIGRKWVYTYDADPVVSGLGAQKTCKSSTWSYWIKIHRKAKKSENKNSRSGPWERLEIRVYLTVEEGG